MVNSWEPAVDSEQNVVLISIPSVKDPKLAPAGKHTLHAYLPATEPFAIWEGAHTASGLSPALCDHAWLRLFHILRQALVPRQVFMLWHVLSVA